MLPLFQRAKRPTLSSLINSRSANEGVNSSLLLPWKRGPVCFSVFDSISFAHWNFKSHHHPTCQWSRRLSQYSHKNVWRILVSYKTALSNCFVHHTAKQIWYSVVETSRVKFSSLRWSCDFSLLFLIRIRTSEKFMHLNDFIIE